ncbi:MAG TPA: pyridoxal-phosphate dependent enzyme [Acidimicrobiales bacterium]
MARWQHNLDLPGPWQDITMGEGGTPLIPLDPGRPQVLAKLEHLMPTLSFKARGAAVLVSVAAGVGATRLVADSSGNAGTAIAAYAARARLPCQVFVPEGTSPGKVARIAAHGAAVEVVKGDREDAAKAAIDAVEDSEAFYASHAWHPAFLEGTKTFAFEVWEQLGRQAPDEVVLPVGNGTLLLGAALGFDELLAAGLITARPRLIGVQAEACNPLEQAWRENVSHPVAIRRRPTAADGIAIATPPRGSQILAAVRASGGRFVAVDEEAISRAQVELAGLGLSIEPTAAAVYAGLLTHLAADGANARRIVMPLCGAGVRS